MSKIADSVAALLDEICRHNTIVREHYVNYKGKRLFFDFYVKEINVLIEVQGRQHEEFVEHFHTDRQGFIASRRRDNLKIEYCQENDITLVTINHDEKLTKDRLLNKIWAMMIS